MKENHEKTEKVLLFRTERNLQRKRRREGKSNSAKN